MDCVIGVGRDVNASVTGKALELMGANRTRLGMNQLSFADETALVDDSVQKLCRQVFVKV